MYPKTIFFCDRREYHNLILGLQHQFHEKEERIKIGVTSNNILQACNPLQDEHSGADGDNLFVGKSNTRMFRKGICL